MLLGVSISISKSGLIPVDSNQLHFYYFHGTITFLFLEQKLYDDITGKIWKSLLWSKLLIKFDSTLNSLSEAEGQTHFLR